MRAELEDMLARTGHSADETDFLDHMLEVRALDEPEPPLITSDATYHAVLAASTLTDRGCRPARAKRSVPPVGTSTPQAYAPCSRSWTSRPISSATAAAPRTSRASCPASSNRATSPLRRACSTELVNRQTHNTGPWPELSGRLEAALGTAAGPTIDARARQGRGRRPLARGRGARDRPLSRETPAVRRWSPRRIALKDEGIAVAEQLLGRRVIDLLNAAAPETPWHLLGPVVRRLAAEGDPHSIATIEALMERPDEQSRREVVAALASVQGPLANRLLAGALRDPRPETVAVAARAIARSGEPGSAALLAARLGELDIDRGDFPLAKELIGALARTPEPAADEALAKLGSRRSFIKRGHFADVQSLVAEAQRARRGGIPK